MELLQHLFYFAICSVLLAAVWLIFLFFNNKIDYIQNSLIQGLCGTVNTVVLIAMIGLVVYYYALSFFAGILLTMILIFLVYTANKVWTGIRATGN